MAAPTENSMLTLLIASLLVACGEKEASETSAVAEATAEAATVVPADKNSTAFGTKLMANDFSGMKPVEGAVKLTYSTLKFSPSGSWTAQGVVEIADEGMECMESGSWSMETAASDSTATVAWTIEKTTCAGRESGGETRAELTIMDSGSYKMKMR